MKKQQSGFTLIELMIVVAIIGILSLFALSAYQDYTKRTYVAEGLQLATAAKIALIEDFSTRGDWINAGNGSSGATVNAELGLAAPTAITGQAVKSVHVVGVDDSTGDGARVIITFNDRVVDNGIVYVEAIQHGSFIDITSIEWKCGHIYGTGMEERWLPAVCRGNMSYL